MTGRRNGQPEMRGTEGGATHSDALVIFGVSGDLSYKMIFPALRDGEAERSDRRWW